MNWKSAARGARRVGIVAFATGLVIVGGGNDGCDNNFSDAVAPGDSSVILAVTTTDTKRNGNVLAVGDTGWVTVEYWAKTSATDSATFARGVNATAVSANSGILLMLPGDSIVSDGSEVLYRYQVFAADSGHASITVTPTYPPLVAGASPLTVPIVVRPKFAMTSPSYIVAATGTPFHAQLTATDSLKIASLTSGSLPPGLTMSALGAISGTPLDTGTFTFSVTLAGVHDQERKVYPNSGGYHLDEAVKTDVTIAVGSPLTNARIAPSPVAILVDSTQALALLDQNNQPIHDAIWSSSDPTVATVSASGVVTGIKAGSATITASLDGGQATDVVTVEQPIGTLELSPVDTTVHPPLPTSFGMRATVVTTSGSSDASAGLTWLTSDPSIATVDSTGLVTMHALGHATITAMAIGVTAHTTVTADTLPAKGTITGVVTYTGTSQTIANATVHVYSSATQSSLTFTTNTGGRYTTSPLDPGTYTVWAVPPGQPGGSTTASVAIAAGQADTVNLTAPGQGRISGVVTDTAGHAAVHAQVTFSEVGATGSAGPVSTDSSGFYMSPWLAAPNTWKVQATLNGTVDTASTGVTLGGDAQVNLTLDTTSAPLTTGSIAGTVIYTGTTSPVWDATVTLNPGNTTVQTDSAGAFSFTGLAIGKYTVQATMAGTTGASSLDTLTVAGGNTTTDTLHLPGFSQIYGFLTDSLGNAADSASVTFVLKGTSTTYGPVKADTGGYYNSPDLPSPNTYVMTAAYGSQTLVDTISVVPTADSEVDLQFPAAPAPTTGKISGMTYYQNTTDPVDQGTITVNPGNIQSTADSLGNFTVSNLSPGTYTVYATQPGTTASSPVDTLAVTAGGNTYATLVVPGVAILGATVQTSTGTPAVNAQVTITVQGDTTVVATGNTDTNGMFSANLSAPGSYTISVSAATSTYYNITVQPGMTYTPTIKLP